MAFYIFDFDGTLCDVTHRRPLLDERKWDEFFEACDQDPPFADSIALIKTLLAAGHRVEIWSGRSAAVEVKSRVWLGAQEVPPEILKRMRPVGDYQPDEKLKRSWLHEEIALGNRPDVIFDDRQKVVDMWRAEGMICYQVNAGDFDSPSRVNPNYLYSQGGVPLLTIMVGPPGAGKTTLARERFDPQTVVSSDQIRKHLCGSFSDQSRNKDVFTALHILVAARLSVGLPTVVDATSVKRADRVKLASLADPLTKVAYLVVDRELGDNLTTAGDHRLDVYRYNKLGERQNLVQKMDQVFRSNLKDIRKGDGLNNVEVYFGWAEYEEALNRKARAHFEAGDGAATPDDATSVDAVFAADAKS